MLLTLISVSSTPSSASSAEALAPVSGKRVSYELPLAPHTSLSAIRKTIVAGGGSRTDLDGALDDHGAVGLIDDAIDLLQVIGVRDDLVSGDDILRWWEAGLVLRPNAENIILPRENAMRQAMSQAGFLAQFGFKEGAYGVDNHFG